MLRRLIVPVLVSASLVAACGEERRRKNNDDDDGGGGSAAQGGSSGIGGTIGIGGSGAEGGASAVGSGASGGAAPTEIAPGDLVITEIMNNPAAVTDDAGEWFEIYNASGRVLDLVGLVIRHQADDTPVVPITVPLVVSPGAYALLGRNGDPTLNGGVALDYVYPPEVSLHNAEDHLAIETADGVIIDATSWNELSGLDPDGASRSLDASSLAADLNDDDFNFCAATTKMASSSDYGTPGGPNPACF